MEKVALACAAVTVLGVFCRHALEQPIDFKRLYNMYKYIYHDYFISSYNKHDMIYVRVYIYIIFFLQLHYL